MRFVRILALLAALPAAARADRADQAELDFGPTNLSAALGHGALTAGISAEGDLTLLRWPSPSYYDQMQYATTVTAGDPAPRAQPHFGAAASAGAFVGLYTEPGGLTWLRDAAWHRTQSFRNDDSIVLVTSYRNDTLGISVMETSAVAPAPDAPGAAADVLTRRYDVQLDTDRSYAVVRLVAFANFAPNAAKDPAQPTDETAGDAGRDFACVYSDAQRGIVEFAPTGRDAALLTPLGDTPTPAAVDSFLAGLTAPGAYLVWGGDRTPTTWQCGHDQAFPADPGVPSPPDPLDDAADGALSDSSLSRVHTDGALMWDVDVTGDSEITLYFSVGATFDEAQKRLSPARAAGAPAIANLSDAATVAFNASSVMPSQTLQQVARRALLTIYTARDRASGGIVSSVASQPALHFDRTAEGAFLNLALDAAGHADLVLEHLRFYVRAQRVQPQAAATPAGSFAASYYTDGAASPRTPPTASGAATLPIDSLGFLLWSFGEHAKWLPDDAARRTYLAEVWDPIQNAANLLTDCVDSATDLPCLRQEGDSQAPQQTLRGAEAAYLGLFAAVKVAAFLEHSGLASRWQERMFFLRAAIDRALATTGPARGFLGKDGGYAGDQTSRAIAIWPAAVHAFTDTRIEATARGLENEVGAFVAATAPAGGPDPARALLGVAMYEFREGANDEQVQAEVKGWFTRLATQLRTPGTISFGQASIFDGSAWDQRVGQPSATEAAYVYLATLAVSDARTLVRPELLLPTSSAGGFHCLARVAGGDAGGGAALVVAGSLLLVGVWRRRRRGR